ncbi:hypothetical protein ASD86_07040 [Lysobacter sp. Root690]|nr:hypothetical protein ASD86_07040 [Lysobacter sp. Root690]
MSDYRLHAREDLGWRREAIFRVKALDPRVRGDDGLGKTTALEDAAACEWRLGVKAARAERFVAMEPWIPAFAGMTA